MEEVPTNSYIQISMTALYLHVAVLASTSQELRLHGVEMQGPCEKLRRAGASGKWTSNIQRDMLRTASSGDDVSWWKPLHFGVVSSMIIIRSKI